MNEPKVIELPKGWILFQQDELMIIVPGTLPFIKALACYLTNKIGAIETMENGIESENAHPAPTASDEDGA